MSQNIMITHLIPTSILGTKLRMLIVAFIGSMLLTLSAKMIIPVYPVYISMQTFCVFFLGCMLGSRLALASVILYLLEGAFGLPVFQGTPERGIGLTYMVGPTGGYLVGFMVSSFIVGLMAENGYGKTVQSAVVLFTVGALINDLFGLSWLTVLFDWNTAQSIWLSYQVPFVLKTALGATVVPGLWGLIQKSKTN